MLTMSLIPLSRESDYQFPPHPLKAELTRAIWNAVLLDVSNRIRGIEVKGTELDQVIADLRMFGLERLDTAIIPLIDQTTAQLAELRSLVDATIAANNQIIADFQEATSGNLEEIEAAVAAVQQRIDDIIGGGIAAGLVLEDEERVFVTPEEKAQIAGISSRAPLASPAFTGNPTAPTQALGNNTTRIATTAYVVAEIAQRISGKANSEDLPVAANGQTLIALEDSGAFVTAKAIADAMAPVTFNAAIAMNLKALINGRTTLVANTTFPTPTGLVPGQTGYIEITSGGFTASFAAALDFGLAGAPTIAAKGVLRYEVNADANRLRCVYSEGGF